MNGNKKNLIPNDLSGLHGISQGFMDFWHLFSRNPVGLLGFYILVFFALLAIFADVIAPVNPWGLGKVTFAPPFTMYNHILGTDDLGRDIYSGVVHGTRVSLLVGIFSAFFTTVVGIVVGSISGYFGGRTDDLLMRITELFMVFPAFVLALVLSAFFVPSIWNVILVLTIVQWPTVARLARAEFLRLKELSFVEALRALGAKNMTIVFMEILPNAFPPLIINGTLLVGRAILLEAGLSFFGLGDPTLISWGYMLQNASMYLRTAWWMAFFPGLAISTMVLGVNIFGDSLSEILNPRTKQIVWGVMAENEAQKNEGVSVHGARK